MKYPKPTPPPPKKKITKTRLGTLLVTKVKLILMLHVGQNNV